jgi:signal transduction histidine kinase/CheY-like chemotaxis protein
VKIRAHLVLIAIATLLPVVVFSAIAINKLLNSERQSAIRNLQETARLTALMVDRELQSAQAALLVLGTSQSMLDKDLRGFYAEAQAADRGFGAATVLSDSQGRQLINTIRPLGADLPQADASGHVAEVLRRQTTTISSLEISPATGNYVTAVSIPVMPDETRHYVLSETFDSYYFARVFAQGNIPGGWAVAILDAKGRYIACSRNDEQLVGQNASSDLAKTVGGQAEGWIRHRSADGVDSYEVFTHSGFSGWTVVVSAPVDIIEGTARQAVLVSSIGLLIALLGAIGTAVLVGHRLACSIQVAGESATALGHGEPPSEQPTGVEEVDRLNAVLKSVGKALMHEKSSRQQAEAERERLLISEQVARKNAEDQNAAKDRFIAMLGHELRNPLSAITGAVSLTKAGCAAPEVVDRAHAIIERQSSHLSHIVDDLLDLSRLSMGKISLDLVTIDLAAVARACVEALPSTRPHAPVRTYISEEPIWVRADRTRLDQIVTNLLGNALKFTPASGIIDVMLKSERDTAILTIRDSGIGISRELMPFIFDAFVQGEAQSDRSIGGLGIGLNLVRQLVELHGGSVHVASDGMGKGTTVSVHLPRVRADQSAADAEQEQAAPVTATGTILLVEDNEDSRDMMSSLLRLKGFRVLEAANGASGIRLAREEQPTIAIIDIGLPDMDGYDVARRLRGSADTRDIRLVALTGYGQESDRQRALQAGFELHLVKPVDAEMLLSAIAQLHGSTQPAH